MKKQKKKTRPGNRPTEASQLQNSFAVENCNQLRVVASNPVRVPRCLTCPKCGSDFQVCEDMDKNKCPKCLILLKVKKGQ